MNKVAVIFGVTGQDGSYLSEFLLDKDYHVVGVARRTSTPNTSRISHLLDNKNFTLESGDVLDFANIHDILWRHRADEVYNLAAQSHVGVSFKQPILTWDITAKGCLNILESITKLDKKPRFYQASSSEMFGDQYTISKSGDKHQAEDTLFNPQSPYAVAKLAAHKMTELYRKTHSLHASCGILFNHESERRGENFVTRKISKYISTFDPLGPKLYLGNLDSCRDWGHAKDYVRAMWLMLQQDSPGTYVIATGVTHSVRDFVREAFKCIGVDDYEKFVEIDKKQIRPSEVPYLKGDYSKAREAMGWMPEISFGDLVSIMVQYDIARTTNDTQSTYSVK